MSNSDCSLCLPAEWELPCDILLAWPHENTDWNYMLSEVRNCYVNMIRAFISAGHRVLLLMSDVNEKQLNEFDESDLIRISYCTNDTWTRDYGPITLVDKQGECVSCDFTFNGWGLKFASYHDNVVTRFLTSKGLLRNRKNCLEFVLEGGGIESNGKGVILTSAITQFSPNRNAGLSDVEVEDALLRYMHAERILMLHHGFLAGDDTDSHIDTLARFAPGDTIIYIGCDNPDDEHYAELLEMKRELQLFRTVDGMPYNLIELPLPDAIFDESGERLPATYANFLATDKAVFLPIYGQPQKDLLAEQMLKIVFDKPVYTVDCNALIKQHGSLHCATMQLPHNSLRI